MVQHVGQSHSEGPVIRREGPSILYTHITPECPHPTRVNHSREFVVWEITLDNEVGLAAQTVSSRAILRLLTSLWVSSYQRPIA